MCGIAGIVNFNQAVSRRNLSILQESLFHRGPDDQGIWLSNGSDVGLVHTRLSIIDLSDTGHQPMHSDDGRYTIVFNGEIYNYRRLKDEMESTGVQFASSSDTEVMLKLWIRFGEAALDQVRGMYAFAIWDSLKKTIIFARDPLGIKPLFFSIDTAGLAFSSELRALRNIGRGGGVSPQAVGAFLQWGSVPAPITLYEGIEALQPGHLVCYDLSTREFRKHQYWSYASQFAHDHTDIITNRDEAIELVRETLLSSVTDHLVSDVPVGAFLSGGIDSTAVVSLMRQAGQDKIATFSITFDDDALDESHYSQFAAKIYQAEHYEWRITQDEFLNAKDEFIHSVDQPTVDGINTWLVAKFAREHGYKVVTSGVGGDEFFYGYDGTFGRLPLLKNYLSKSPYVVNLAISKLLGSRYIRHYAPGKIEKIIGLLERPVTLSNCYDVYRRLFSKNEILKLLKDKDFAIQAASVEMTDFLPEFCADISDQQKISIMEVSRYLGSQLLSDSDKFSMAHGLELRVPLVDRCIAEMVSKIDPALFYDNRETPKSLLVRAVGDLPDEIVYRSKQGFTLPIGDWIRQDKHDMSNSFICDDYWDLTVRQRKAGGQHWSKQWAIDILNRKVFSEN